MTSLIFSIFLWLLLCSNSILADEPLKNEQYLDEEAIVKKCLTDKSGNIARSDLEKVAHFGSWSQDEEVLCFTHCLSSHKGWFDVSGGNWIRDKLEADLGDKMYKYCQNELERSYESVCDFVFKGFRCLRDASMNIAETYKTLLICANELNVSDVAELQKYGTFPKEEHIPCLFKCFAEKWNFYDTNLDWIFDNWIKAFGPLKTPAGSDTYQACRASEEKRSQEDQKCAWMYEEYLCLEQFSNSEKAVETATMAQAEKQEQLEESTKPEEPTENVIEQAENDGDKTTIITST